MEELKNCNICGKLFKPYRNSEICIRCYEQDENDFSKLRDYLYEHPLAKIFEVVTNTDLTVSKIKRYLREGRLEIVEKVNRFLLCETCGKPIRSGKYCNECGKKASHDIKVLYTGGQAKTSERIVNFLSGNKKKALTR